MELFICFLSAQNEASRNAAMARLREVRISLRLAGVMERYNSRMALLVIACAPELPHQFLPLMSDPLTYNLQQPQGLTRRSRLSVPGGGGALRFVEPDTMELPGESPEGHVVAQ
jgi:hypothetical protein